MNVARRLPDNTVNEKEPNAQQIVIEFYFYVWKKYNPLGIFLLIFRPI